MGIQVDWDSSEHTVILFVFEGRWDLNEFYAAFQKGDGLMDSVDYRVHIILDMRKSGSLPNGFFGTIRSLGAKPHRNLGQMALVGANGFIQSFINISRKIFPVGSRQPRFSLVASVQEAREIFTPVEKAATSG